MPTMVSEAPFTTRSEPTAAGERAKVRDQKLSLITATGDGAPARMSSGPNRRPIWASCRSRPKQPPEKSCTRAGSG